MLFKRKPEVPDEERIDKLILEAAKLKGKVIQPTTVSGHAAKTEKVKAQITPKQPKKEPVTMAQEKEVLPQLEQGKVSEIKSRSGLSWLDKWKMNRKPDSSYIIEMFFSNGTCRTFVITTRRETFTYKGREYVLRYQDSSFDLSRNQFKLTFHEDHCLPLEKEIVIRDPEQGDKWGAALRAVNSSNLKALLKFEYVKILAENLLSRYIKLCLIGIIIIFLFCIIILLGLARLGAFSKGG